MALLLKMPLDMSVMLKKSELNPPLETRMFRIVDQLKGFPWFPSTSFCSSIMTILGFPFRLAIFVSKEVMHHWPWPSRSWEWQKATEYDENADPLAYEK
jgi:hypothetical protein